MSGNTIEAQFTAAFTAAGSYHGLLNFEIAKKSPSMDVLFEYADKLRDSVMVMRILDDVLKRQAEADALAVPRGRA